MHLSMLIIVGFLLTILGFFAYLYIPLPTKKDRIHFALGVIPLGLLLSGVNFFVADLLFTNMVDVAFRDAPRPTGFIWSMSRYLEPRSVYSMLSLLPLPTIGGFVFYRYLKKRGE